MNYQTRVFDLLDESKLNWSVEKVQLVPLDGNTHRNVPDSFGMYRRDNGEWLGTVGNQYQAVQNSQLAEIFVQALDAIGLDADTRGGCLSGGKKVYLQAKLNDHHIANDTIKRYLTSLNSHDGSCAAGFGASNTVVSCQNTFYRALKDVKKFRHTGNVRDRIEIEAANLVRLITDEKTVMQVFGNMAQAPVMPKTINGLLNGLFKVTGDTDLDSLSSRKKNQIITVTDTIKAEIKSHGNTIWGLFNGITYYYNHVANTKDRQKYLMEDSGMRMQNKAFDILKSEVSEAVLN